MRDNHFLFYVETIPFRGQLNTWYESSILLGKTKCDQQECIGFAEAEEENRTPDDAFLTNSIIYHGILHCKSQH